MTRTDLTGLPASAVLRLGLLAGLLAAAGCSGPPAADQRDIPEVKATFQKQAEAYQTKTKTQALKGQRPPASNRRP
jgi:hypothetical protein